MAGKLTLKAAQRGRCVIGFGVTSRGRALPQTDFLFCRGCWCRSLPTSCAAVCSDPGIPLGGDTTDTILKVILPPHSRFNLQVHLSSSLKETHWTTQVVFPVYCGVVLRRCHRLTWRGATQGTACTGEAQREGRAGSQPVGRWDGSSVSSVRLCGWPPQTDF